MLTHLFRDVRNHPLALEGFRRYLVYALGELVLVVAGILIALQINGWNQNRKDRQLEKTLITEARNALNGDRALVAALNDRIARKRAAIARLLRLIDSPETISADELGELHATATLQFLVSVNLGPYQAIKSVGLDKIRDYEVRAALVDFFDFSAPRFVDLVEVQRANLMREQQNYLDMRFRYVRLATRDDGTPVLLPDTENHRLLQDPNLYAELKLETVVVDSFDARLAGLERSLDEVLEGVEGYLGGM
jgi:hypothetical protein